MIKIYADGAASNNGKENAIGGWAFIVIENDEIIYQNSGAVKKATNQQMELMAILNACKYISKYLVNLPEYNFKDIEVYSDSAYAINCYQQKWYMKWELNNWVNSKKEAVANKKLWEDLIPYFNSVNYNFKKVKGHSEDNSLNSHYNNYVDKLAVQARLLVK